VRFPHISNFATRDPVKLGEQLSRFEDNLDRALSEDSAAAAKRLSLALFNPATVPKNIVKIQAEQQLLVDSSAGDVSVLFPALSPQNYGKMFVLLRRSTSNAVSTACVDPSVKCNGSLTWPGFTGASNRAVIFFCDPTGYYR
jgi:hypothetical protein